MHAFVKIIAIYDIFMSLKKGWHDAINVDNDDYTLL